MKIIKEMPKDYKRITTLSLQKDKKASTLVNIISIIIGIAMLIPMHIVNPITSVINLSEGMEGIMTEIIALVIAMTVYIIIREAIHALFMKILGCKKIKFMFTGLYAFAATDELIPMNAFTLIALAPVIILGIILLVCCILIPLPVLWLVYILLVVNVSGVVGDVYNVIKLSKLPKDILIHDNGLSMNIYSKEDYVEIPKEKEYEI